MYDITAHDRRSQRWELRQPTERPATATAAVRSGDGPDAVERGLAKARSVDRVFADLPARVDAPEAVVPATGGSDWTSSDGTLRGISVKWSEEWPSLPLPPQQLCYGAGLACQAGRAPSSDRNIRCLPKSLREIARRVTPLSTACGEGFVFELLVGSLGLLSVCRGIDLAIRRAPSASSWMAVGAGCPLALMLGVPPTLGAATPLFLTVTGVSAGGALLIAAGLKREYTASLDAADEAQIKRLVDEARAHRLSLRLRGRAGVGRTRPSDHHLGSRDVTKPD